MNDIIHPVLLCGGFGTRLWPLSRKSYPKQFVKLMGEESLFQSSSLRLSGTGFGAPSVVTGSDFRFMVVEQLAAVEIAPRDILIEPFIVKSGRAKGRFVIKEDRCRLIQSITQAFFWQQYRQAYEQTILLSEQALALKIIKSRAVAAALSVILAVGPALAETRRGPVTNLPMPRYVSLKTSEGNVRRGPSLTHRIDWVFKRRGMPL